jgi:TusA-related sulfurtransferase
METKKEIVLDVSELEAPYPLVEAINALNILQDDEVLIFRHRMNPQMLYQNILALQLQFDITKEEENEFEMRIYK